MNPQEPVFKSSNSDLINKLKNSTYMIIVIVIFLACAGWLSTFFLPKDNPVEEIAEDLIEVETGIKPNLSP